MLKPERHTSIGLQWGRAGATALMLSCPRGVCAPRIAALCVLDSSACRWLSPLDGCEELSHWLKVNGGCDGAICVGIPIADSMTCVDEIPVSVTADAVASYCGVQSWRLGHGQPARRVLVHQVLEETSVGGANGHRVLYGSIWETSLQRSREIVELMGGDMVEWNSVLLAACNGFMQIKSWHISSQSRMALVYADGQGYGVAVFRGGMLVQTFILWDMDGVLNTLSAWNQETVSSSGGVVCTSPLEVYVCGDCQAADAVCQRLRGARVDWSVSVLGIPGAALLPQCGMSEQGRGDDVHPELVVAYGLALQAMGMGIYAPQSTRIQAHESADVPATDGKSRTKGGVSVAGKWSWLKSGAKYCGIILLTLAMEYFIDSSDDTEVSRKKATGMTETHEERDGDVSKGIAGVETACPAMAGAASAKAEDGERSADKAGAIRLEVSKADAVSAVERTYKDSARNGEKAQEAAITRVSCTRGSVRTAVGALESGNGKNDSTNSDAPAKREEVAASAGKGAGLSSGKTLYLENVEKQQSGMTKALADGGQDAGVAKGATAVSAGGEPNTVKPQSAEKPQRVTEQAEICTVVKPQSTEKPQRVTEQAAICAADETAVKLIGLGTTEKEGILVKKGWFIVHPAKGFQHKRWLDEGQDCAGLFSVKQLKDDSAVLNVNGEEITVEWQETKSLKPAEGSSPKP